MKKSFDDYYLEDLIRESEKTLKEVGDIGEIPDELPEKLRRKLANSGSKSDILNKEQDSASHSDACIDITITEDGMAAFADFHPSGNTNEKLTRKDVESVLEEQHITTGVDWETIDKTLLTCAGDPSPVVDVEIARGTEPETEIPGHIVLSERMEPHLVKPDKIGERIDFKLFTPFISVKEGEVLARHIPLKKGKPGVSVTGQRIPYPVSQIRELRPGENTVERDGIIHAAHAGRFEFQDPDFWITEMLEIDSDIDYHTGHIDFPGDIAIHGQVKEGFHVKAGGSVFCKQTLDATHIQCGGELVVAQGIIGKKKGIVKADGDIKTKFVENCFIETKGTLYSEGGVINSAVYAEGEVKLGKNGIIVGGSIHAKNGIEAVQIGTDRGPKTEIYCGTDFTITRRLQWIRDKTVELTRKVQKIDETLQKDKKEEKKLLDLKQKLQTSIDSLNNKAKELVTQLEQNDKAEIRVSKVIYPGVYIEMCNASLTVKQKMEKSVFRFDPEKNTIIAEKK